MAEIIQCPSCKRKLQLPESLIHQDVQCPSCNATFVATPGTTTGSAAPPYSAPPPLPERRSYVELPPSRRDDFFDDDEEDYDRSRRRRRRDLTPHRGGLILALGIIGLVAGCIILSPIAWVMGNQDLTEIRAGRMDPEGEGLTQAGRILGIIGTVIMIFYVGLLCLVAASGIR